MLYHGFGALPLGYGSYGSSVTGKAVTTGISGAATGLSVGTSLAAAGVGAGTAATGAAAGAAAGSVVPVIGTAVGAAAGVIAGLVIGKSAQKKAVTKMAKEAGLPDPEGVYGFTAKAVGWDKKKLVENLRKFRELNRLEHDKKSDFWQARTWFRTEKGVTHHLIMIEAIMQKKGWPIPGGAQATMKIKGKKGKKDKGKKGKKGKKDLLKTGSRPAGAMATGFQPVSAEASEGKPTIPWVPIAVVGGVLVVGALAFAVGGRTAGAKK